MKILITSLQNLLIIRKRPLRILIRLLLIRLGFNPEESMSIVLTNNEVISRINNEYFGKKFPTDVISFSLSDKFDPDKISGEVVISIEEVISNSRKYHVGSAEELMRYIIHGLLHLKGLSDFTLSQRIKMRKEENLLLNFLEDKEEKLFKRIFK